MSNQVPIKSVSLNTLNERNNYVILITNSTDSGILNNFTYKPINEAENIAKIIKNKYLI